MLFREVGIAHRPKNIIDTVFPDCTPKAARNDDFDFFARKTLAKQLAED
jgi:hypothetical protein